MFGKKSRKDAERKTGYFSLMKPMRSLVNEPAHDALMINIPAGKSHTCCDGPGMIIFATKHKKTIDDT